MMLRFLRAWAILLGGMLIGAGLCLHGQIAVAHAMREQVASTFFLWRGIGELTFVFQDDVTKAALWMNEIPAEVLRQSDAAAWTLVVLGGVLVGAAPFVRRRRRRR